MVTSNLFPFYQVLRDNEMKYDILDKHAYALVKALNSFRMYVLQPKIIMFIPTIAVKDILVQGENEGKRGRWIAKIQKYELEIKHTKLIKGQGLAKILSESNFQALGIRLIIEEGSSEDEHNKIKTVEQKIYSKYEGLPRYKNIIHYLLFRR